MDAELEQQIKALAIGRIGLGAAALVAPGPMLKRWLGKGHDTPGARTLARFIGARDVALGVGTLFAVNRGSPARGWIEAGMLADAGDLLATLLAAKHLSKLTTVSTAFAAAGGVAYARRLVSQLEAQSAEAPEPGPQPLEPAP